MNKIINVKNTTRDCYGDIVCAYESKLFSEGYNVSDFPIVKDINVDGEVWYRVIELLDSVEELNN
jgi:hypothetical protein